MLKKRRSLIAAFIKRRKNLMTPMTDIIWDLTKDIDGHTEFRMAVNILFREDCKKPDDRASFEKALQRFYRSKVHAEGLEYILAVENQLSKVINEKY